MNFIAKCSTIRRAGSCGPVRGARILSAMLGILGAAAASVADAQRGDTPEPEAQGCIPLMSIDRTEVVDERTILFYMKNDDVFRNELDNSCPGLRFDERFMYEVRTSQLCSSDVITVVMDLGFGFQRGASCGLGDFQPISEALAEQLRDEAKRND